MKGFKVGDKVYSEREGEGEVVACYPRAIYPISVKFDNGHTDSFTALGWYESEDPDPYWDITHLEEEEEPQYSLEEIEENTEHSLEQRGFFTEAGEEIEEKRRIREALDRIERKKEIFKDCLLYTSPSPRDS